ncbi:WcbI family polysaccharide biosynthesis putative acetyltransferase [Methylobacterium sp. J-026]|uniref:WcbI family polysaccharide biosynthesis putative acetyltransferase n=1 Tax=Methylobacterium sp. J-026 TaxID=2836624 RepID=UPI001FBAEC5C|nr:WcbI family polysaccharide biosynthesis putative acetyltransferase [Methylobacterium sp. J-026]MCJ2132485.1 WcbI family polysaccharide biosynthesis putative acetyltransferase [Methylobacterium sp. J-026]
MSASQIKNIVFVGNCNATDLVSFFSQITSLKDDFEFHPLALHITPTPSPDVQAIVDSAHAVFIQGIAEAERYERESVPPGVARLGYPNLLRRAFWPFDGLIYGRDRLAEADAAQGGLVRFPDGLLARLRDDVPDPEARFAAYRDLAVPGLVKSFARFLEMENETLGALDATYRCDLGAFIRDNDRTRQLFHWLGHPSGILYRELMAYCCGKLGIAPELPDPSALDAWGTMQVPVHPAVAEQLGLEWAQPGRTYHYAPMGQVTWEAFTRAYIRHLG